MNSQVAEQNEPNTWTVPQCPFRIEWAAEILDRIRREVEAAFNSARGEREAGGLLFGQNESNRIRILDCRPLPCEHAMGPGFVLSKRDEGRLAELVAAPESGRELNGLVAVGWYHSHAHSSIFLSERDLDVHNRNFPHPFEVALVLRPQGEGYTRGRVLLPGCERRNPRGCELSGVHGQDACSGTASRQPNRSPVRKSAEVDDTPVCRKCGGKRIHRSHRQIFEWIWALFGLYPYRCEECLTRTLRRRSDPLLALTHTHSARRPEEKKRAWMRTRREILLYSGGVIGFLVFLLYLIRDTGPKPDQP